jgi:hypothetical protein
VFRFIWKDKMVSIILPPELEKSLLERAHQQGMTPSDMAVELLHKSLRLPFNVGGTTPDAHQEALAAIQNGRYASLRKPDTPLSSDRFAADKAEERAREERRW